MGADLATGARRDALAHAARDFQIRGPRCEVPRGTGIPLIPGVPLHYQLYNYNCTVIAPYNDPAENVPSWY